MASGPKVIAFAGSARRDSFNKKALAVAVAAARAKGADVTVVDFADLRLPLYDADLEERSGLPEDVKRWKQMLVAHDALLISAPEYNSSITPLLKNAIDWASRPAPGEPPLVCFKGKVAGLISASPGALGGLRGLVTVRSILGNIGVVLIPEQHALSKANEAFDAAGNLIDPKQQEAIARVAERLVDVAARLKG